MRASNTSESTPLWRSLKSFSSATEFGPSFGFIRLLPLGLPHPTRRLPKEGGRLRSVPQESPPLEPVPVAYDPGVRLTFETLERPLGSAVALTREVAEQVVQVIQCRRRDPIPRSGYERPE